MLVDSPDEPPVQGKAADPEGMISPVTFATRDTDPSDAAKIIIGLKQGTLILAP